MLPKILLLIMASWRRKKKIIEWICRSSKSPISVEFGTVFCFCFNFLTAIGMSAEEANTKIHSIISTQEKYLSFFDIHNQCHHNAHYLLFLSLQIFFQHISVFTYLDRFCYCLFCISISFSLFIIYFAEYYILTDNICLFS